MLPLKLYLVRAVRDWALDSNFTPHVLIDATPAGVKIPPGYAENGRIVLNIHPRAVNSFDLVDDWLRFSARFGSVSYQVEVPSAAVLAVYAKENGQGISFPEASAGAQASGAGENSPAGKPTGKGPVLKIVK